MTAETIKTLEALLKPYRNHADPNYRWAYTAVVNARRCKTEKGRMSGLRNAYTHWQSAMRGDFFAMVPDYAGMYHR